MRIIRSRDQDPLGDVEEELRFHLDRQADELVAAGWDPEAAREEARRRFGDPARVRETLEDMGRRRRKMTSRTERWGELSSDLSFALRQVRRRPAFAVAAVVVIALGVGVSSAVFAVLDATWLRPLPFPDPGRIVVLDDVQDQPGYPPSLPEFRDWKRDADFLSAAAALTTSQMNLQLGDPERVGVGFVAGDVMTVTGLEPLLGRGFTVEERSAADADVIMLGEDFWRARMGADPGVLGRALTLDGREHDVVGVMPREAELLFERDVDLWVPLGDSPGLTRGLHTLLVAGRLAEGVELEEASARAEVMATALRESGVTRHGVRLSAVRDILFEGTDRIVLILTGAVALVLVVVSANLAHLFIVRGWARAREFAVRGALGAGTGRIARQLLTESVLLGLVGAVGGIVVARALTGWVARAAGNETVLELADGSNARVVLFAVTAAVAVGALFGLLPALRAGRVDPARELRGGREGGGNARRTRLRHALVASEVALSAVLLVGAGLLVRTLGQLIGEDTGFVAHGVLTGEITLPQERYPTAEARAAFSERLIARLRALPGVESAGITSHLPLLGDTNGGFEIVGREFPEDAGPVSKKRFVGSGYFDAMGMRVLRGRDILPSDRRGGPEVAVVSEALVARYFPDENPIGKRVRFLWETEQEQEIVGVVADVRSDDLHLREEGTMYLAADQIGLANLAIAIRARGSEEALAEPLRQAVREIDPELPVSDVQTVSSIVRGSVANRTTMMQLLTAFGALALLLAGVGVYAVAAQAVAARTRDIGVRLAVGGSAGRVVRAVVLREALPVGIGMALGLAAAGPAARVLSTLLYDVSPTDPATLASVAVILGLASAGALVVPTLRAVRIDPAAVLRGD